MVIKVAAAGRGSHSLILDDSNQLNTKVITALAQAFEPSLKGCKLTFGDKQEELNEVFRNQTLFRSALMSTKQFQQMKFEFSSQLDPVTKEPIDLQFDKNDFRKIEDKSYAQALFKSAANSMIKAFKNQKEGVRKGMSIKYQVLSDETAMIGIIKQKDKASGDLKTFEQKL